MQIKVTHITTKLAIIVAGRRRRLQAVGGVAAERVGLDLEVPAGRRQVEPDHGAVDGDPAERHRSGHVARYRRPVVPFVLAPHRPTKLNAPDLIGPRGIA